MPLQLKNKGTQWPPSGYPYVDGRTGKKFDGMSADLDMQVKNVLTHRQANPRIYPPDQAEFLNPASVRQELVNYICSLKPELCGQPEVKTQTNLVVPQPNKVCPKCQGTVFKANYCQTCGSGNKIKSWSCVACGTNVGK